MLIHELVAVGSRLCTVRRLYAAIAISLLSALAASPAAATWMPVDVSIVEVVISDASLHEKVLTITLFNEGPGTTSSSSYLDVYTKQGSARRQIAFEMIDLAAGQTRTYVYVWDTLGQIGNATLLVSAFASFDQNPGDNERRIGVPLLLPGIAPPVDALNHRVERQLVGTDHRVLIDYEGEGNLSVDVDSTDHRRYYLVVDYADDGSPYDYAIVCVYAIAPCQFVFLPPPLP